jgi:hypothetical protein
MGRLLGGRGALVLFQAYPDLVTLPAAMPGVAFVVGTHPVNVPYLRVPADRPAASLGPRTRPPIILRG